MQKSLARDVFVSGRWRWTLPDATGKSLVEDTVSQLRFPKATNLTVMKSNPARRVISVAGDIPLLVKRYRVRTTGECLKHIVAPSKAAAAFRGSQMCAKKAIPVSQVIAWGEKRHGIFLRESCIIEKRIDKSVPLGRHIHDSFAESTGGRRTAVMSATGSLLAKIHAAGLSHPDFHPGNILIRWDDRGNPDIFVVDLHSVRPIRLLRSRRRARDIAKMYHSLSLITEEADLKEFLAGYSLDAGTFRVSESRIAHLARKLERARLRSRTKRCVKESSQFTKEKVHGLTVYRRRDWPTTELQAVLREHEEAKRLRDARLVKESRKSWVTVVPRRSDQRYAKRLVVKEPRLRLSPGARRGTLNIRRMRRAWVAANAFAVRGFSVPYHLALVEKRFLGIPRRAWLVYRYVESALDLNQYLESHPDVPPPFFDQLAEVASRLFACGVYHSDLSGKNVLVKEADDDQWEFYFLDLESVTLWRRLTARRRSDNIDQLCRSISAWGDRKQRECFLHKISNLMKAEPTPQCRAVAK